MAFKPKMPPPPAAKKPDLVVAIGAKPKGNDPMPPKDPVAGDAPDDEADEKIDPAKALVSHADENCGNCENYEPTTGDCEKVSGTFSPDDRCWSSFEPIGDEGEGTEDQPSDSGMPPMAGTLPTDQ